MQDPCKQLLVSKLGRREVRTTTIVSAVAMCRPSLRLTQQVPDSYLNECDT